MNVIGMDTVLQRTIHNSESNDAATYDTEEKTITCNKIFQVTTLQRTNVIYQDPKCGTEKQFFLLYETGKSTPGTHYLTEFFCKL